MSVLLSSHDFFFFILHSCLFFFFLKKCEGDSPKENPYEDVELKGRHASRKSQQLSENSLDSLHRMWTPQDRKYTTPAQVIRYFLDHKSLFLTVI